MNKEILFLIHKMLKLASEEFSNHGCNDLDSDTSDFIEKNESAIRQELNMFLDDDEDNSYFNDSMLMELLAEKILVYLKN